MDILVRRTSPSNSPAGGGSCDAIKAPVLAARVGDVDIIVAIEGYAERKVVGLQRDRGVARQRRDAARQPRRPGSGADGLRTGDLAGRVYRAGAIARTGTSASQ